jgi:glycosyltransferase involved in cell wall biosynthesis
MLGWEFPPHISGGLGTACHGLTKALNHEGTDILFVLPRAVGSEDATHVRLLSPNGSLPAASVASGLPHVEFRLAPSQLASPYECWSPAQGSAFKAHRVGDQNVERRSEDPPRPPAAGGYVRDLLAEVNRYAHTCLALACGESFDVIHAHDWMTYPAGLAIAAQSGKPLVAHLHSTEFDRSGENVQQRVYDIERRGMQGASAVICVSRMTAAVAAERYAVTQERIVVVYNGIDLPSRVTSTSGTKRREKVVLFLGRLTMQKGPEYFLAVAKRVLTLMDDVKFIVAGSGDRFQSTVHLASEMGIGHKVRFTGFLRGDDVAQAFGMADLYVMPSVTEPFGIAPLEAISHGVPVIISKSSGVSEVLEHALKVDFWDIEEMANKIVAVLRHPPLASTLRENALAEIREMTWKKAAGECLAVYRQVCASCLREDQADRADDAAVPSSSCPEKRGGGAVA